MELFPFITTADWQNREHCAHRVLVPHAHKVSPLVAFGILEDGRPKYLSNKGMRKHRLRLENMELDSLERMRFRKERAGWEALPPPGGGTPEMYQKVGDCLTASEIADQRTMKDMQSLMGLERMYVAIPTQETLIAGKDGPSVEKLAQKRLAAAAEKGETPLAAFVYELRDGQIVKLIGHDAEKSTKTGTRNRKITVPAPSASGRVSSASGRISSASGRVSATSTRMSASATYRLRKTPTATNSRGQKTVTIPRANPAPEIKPFNAQATFISIPSASGMARPPTGGSAARQRALLQLPPRMWLPIMALHVFAGAYLAVSIYGLVALVSGALKDGGNFTVYLLLSFAVIPLLWVMSWANYMVISFLKRGELKAYFLSWSLIGIWVIVPFFSISKLGGFAVIPIILGIAMAAAGMWGLMHPETKKHCHFGEETADEAA